MQRMGKDNPDEVVGDIIPIKKNIKTGEHSLATPEILRSVFRGAGDVISEAQRKGTDATPDAAAFMSAALPGAKPILRVGGKAADAAAETAVAGAKGVAAGAKTMQEGWHARTPEVLTQATRNMENEASSSFKSMRASGVGINPQLSTALVNHLQASVEEMGVLNPKIHGDTISVLKQMAQESQKGMSVDRLHQYRKLLRGAEKKNYTSNPEGAQAARNAIDALDEAVETYKAKGGSAEGSKALQSMQNGISTWAKARKFETVADAIERAQGDPNKIKINLKKIYDSKKLSRGFSDEELSALKEASENTNGEGLLKMAGKFGFDLSAGVTGNTAPWIAPLGAIFKPAWSPELAAATTVGTGARYGQKLLARGKAERLLKTIENGSAVDEAIGSSAANPLLALP
jgi:hypothetical protein